MYVLLSYVINHDTPVYGGGTGFVSKMQTSINKGDVTNTAVWSFPNHTGTHIDFPYHFYKNGQTVEDFPLDFWFYSGEDVQLLFIKKIKNEYLIKPEHIIADEFNSNAKVVFLKTNMGRYRNLRRYWEDNLGVSIELEKWIRAEFKKIKIFGLDSISVSCWRSREIGRKVHKKFLNPKKPILIIEDMNLSKVDRSTIFKNVFFIPLMVSKSDGAPCTVIAEIK